MTRPRIKTQIVKSDIPKTKSKIKKAAKSAKTVKKGWRLSETSLSVGSVHLHEIMMSDTLRIITGIKEFDRVLGGGIVPGVTVMIGGDPGIGKSTLLLQVVDRLSQMPSNGKGKCLYVTGEESAQQVKVRAERLGIKSKNLLIFPETDVTAIVAEMKKVRPVLTVIDSIQTLCLSDIDSAPGSVAQVRESAARLVYLAKKEKLPLFLVGHVTKEGSLAGPMTLEHMVDVVLFFEGDLHRQYRLIRVVKNRFGSTQEIGIFEMREGGLKEVDDASKAFMEDHFTHSPGSVITASLEGSRPLLLEVQALVSPTNFGTPQRHSLGIEHNRLALILSILEKRLGLSIPTHDVFLNVAGGIRIVEPAIELSAAVAVVSSLREVPVPPDVLVLGELGLSGEVRGVAQIESRLTEAARLGFKRAIIPQGNLSAVSRLPSDMMEILPVKTLGEAIGILVPA
jgi:DNA repair protein RadA/Sms